MNISDQSTIGQIVRAADAVGTALPKAVTAAHERARRLRSAVHDIGPPRGALAAAVAAAVDAGNDPAGDPQVHRILAAATLSNEAITRDVEGIGVAATTDALHEHRDAIVTAWRKPFDKAAATLSSARQRLGNVTLDDTGTILAKGPDAAAVWAEAQTAVTTIDTVINGWSSLANLRRVPQNPGRSILRIADVPPEQWVELDLRTGDPWAAVSAGLTLSLPTLREYLDRNAAIDHHLAQPATVVDTWRSHVAGHEVRVSG